MRHHFITTLSGMSLALFATTCVLWIKSHESTIAYSRLRAQGFWGLSCENGWLNLEICDVSDNDPGFGLYTPNGSFWQFGGFRHGSNAFARYPSRRDRTFRLRCLTAVILTGVIPAVWTGTKVRRRLMRPAECVCRVCGYDLRATQDRCPECGTVPATATT